MPPVLGGSSCTRAGLQLVLVAPAGPALCAISVMTGACVALEYK